MIFIKLKKFILYILIILVVLVLFAIVSTTLLDQTGFGYETITFNNATALDVPSSSEAVSNKDEYGIYTYKDPKNDLNITSWNSLEKQTIPGAQGKVNEATGKKGTDSPMVENGIPIYYNNKTGIYYVQTANDTTHDNVLISSPNKDLVIKVYGSVRYAYGNASKLVVNMSDFINDNTTATSGNPNSTANSTVNSTSQSSSSSTYYDDSSYYDDSYYYDDSSYYYDESYYGDGYDYYYDESSYYSDDYSYYEGDYAY